MARGSRAQVHSGTHSTVRSLYHCVYAVVVGVWHVPLNDLRSLGKR